MDSAEFPILEHDRDSRVLVEVKGVGGNASERLAEAPARHLATWPALRPDLPVYGVLLILNHQTKAHPLVRDDQPYNRPEFVASLTFPVLTTPRLFDWWRVGDFSTIRVAVVGTPDALRSANEPTFSTGTNEPCVTSS